MRNKIAPVLSDNLLRLAFAYIAAVKASNPKVSLQSVSRTMHGDPPFLEALKAGTSTCGLTKYDEIIARFDTKWPADKRYLMPKLADPRHGAYRKPAESSRKPNGKEKRAAA